MPATVERGKTGVLRWVPLRCGSLCSVFPYPFVAVLVAVWLVVLASTPVFPSQDGPGHVQAAVEILRLLTGSHGVTSQYLELHPRLVPNWFDSVSLPLLVSVFGPIWGEKVFVAASVLLFVICTRYTIRSVSLEADFLVALLLPLAWSVFIVAGFYNYCFGMAFALVPVGYWLRHSEAGWGAVLGLAGLLLALWFVHLVPLAAASVALFCVAGVDVAVRTRDTQTVHASPLLRTALATLPVAILTVFFLVEEPSHVSVASTHPSRLAALMKVDVLASFHRWDLALSGELFAAFAGLMALGVLSRLHTRLRREDGLLAAALLLTLIYFGVPDDLGSGGLMAERVMPFAFLCAGSWFATCVWRPAVRRVAAAVGLVVAAGLILSHSLAYRQLTPYLQEYLSVLPHIREGSVLLPVTFAPWGRRRDGGPLVSAQEYSLARPSVAVFWHASGYFDAQRDVLSLDNFEAPTGHFPLRFRAPADPYKSVWPLLYSDPEKAIRSNSSGTSGRIDYVLLWWPSTADLERTEDQRLVQVIHRAYRLVYVSSGGHAELYARKVELR
jgi:hypothetical protein